MKKFYYFLLGILLMILISFAFMPHDVRKVRRDSGSERQYRNESREDKREDEQKRTAKNEVEGTSESTEDPEASEEKLKEQLTSASVNIDASLADYLTAHYHDDCLTVQAAINNGDYSDSLWKGLTGKDLSELKNEAGE